MENVVAPAVPAFTSTRAETSSYGGTHEGMGKDRTGPGGALARREYVCTVDRLLREVHERIEMSRGLRAQSCELIRRARELRQPGLLARGSVK